MVTTYQYVNIREILSRILRHPLLSDLTIESAVQYTIDFIGLVGLPSVLEDKETTIEIHNYRGLLPCDCVQVTQLFKDNHCLVAMSNAFKDSEYNAFKIQGRLVYTSFKEGNIKISYKAIPIDDEGYPLLPDEPTFLRALELYIKKQWFTILFDLGKINIAVLQNTQQEYAFAVGACTTTFILPSEAEMESIKNMWNQLIPRTNEYKRGLSTLGVKSV